MANILENDYGRRTIRMSTEDVVNIVREYQRLVKRETNIENVRKILSKSSIYIPEDV